MKNKQAKQMLEEITLKDRKVFWFGEETEIFVAKSVEQLVEEFGLPDEDETLEEQSGILPNSYLWRQGYCQDSLETQLVMDWVYGGEDTVVQVSTSYN